MAIYINIPCDMFALGLMQQNVDLTDKNDCARAIELYFKPFISTSPEVILLNVCYRRSVTDSEVFDTVLYDIKTDTDGHVKYDENNNVVKVPAVKGDLVNHKYFDAYLTVFRTLLENHIDIFAMTLEYLHSKDIPVWFSFRMNDSHFVDNPSINSAFSLEHPQFCPNRIFDYAHSEICGYWLTYISEQATKYNIDGIELDFLRGAPYFTGSDIRPERITGLVESIHKVLHCDGKDIKLGIRTYANLDLNFEFGLEIPKWISKGFIDVLTISNFHIPTGYEFPIAKWRKKIGLCNADNNKYILLCGCDYGVCCTELDFSMTPELMSGFADSSLSAGANGVYIFNIAVDDDTTLVYDDEKNVLYHGLEKILDAANNLIQTKRYVHIKDLEMNRYPIVLSHDCAYTAFFMTSPENCECELYIGVKEKSNIEVLYKDRMLKISRVKLPKTLTCDTWLEGQIVPWKRHIAQSAEAVFVTEKLMCKDGNLFFYIKNVGKESLRIEWIELKKMSLI